MPRQQAAALKTTGVPAPVIDLTQDHEDGHRAMVSRLLEQKRKGLLSLHEFLELSQEVEDQGVSSPPTVKDECPPKDEPTMPTEEELWFQAEAEKATAVRGSPMAGSPEPRKSPDKKCAADVLKEQVQAFTKKFKAEPSNINKTRKVPKAPKKARGSSRKQGTRQNDVTLKTLRRNAAFFHDEGIRLRNGQVYCEPCARNVGSSRQAIERHIETSVHVKSKKKVLARDGNLEHIRTALHHFVDTHTEEDSRVPGFTRVPEEVHVFRCETLEQWLLAGIPPHKLDKVRPWLESRTGLSLTGSRHLMASYLPTLSDKEDRQVIQEVSSGLMGLYVDESPFEGEIAVYISRQITPGLNTILRLLDAEFVAKVMDAMEISSGCIRAVCQNAKNSLDNCIAINTDSAAPNLCAYSTTLQAAMQYSVHNTCDLHTGHNSSSCLYTPWLNKLEAAYVGAISRSEAARRLYFVRFGEAAHKKPNTRFWGVNKLRAKSLLPRMGTYDDCPLRQYATDVLELELAKANAQKMLAVLHNRSSYCLAKLELMVSSAVSEMMEMRFRSIEGDGFCYIYAYDHIQEAWNTLQHEVMATIEPQLPLLAEDAPIVSRMVDDTALLANCPTAMIAEEFGHFAELEIVQIIYEQKSIDGLQISLKPLYWNWPQGASVPERVYGSLRKFTSKSQGLVLVKWPDEATCKTERLFGDGHEMTHMLQSELDLRLEGWENGAPAPVITVIFDVFHLARTDLRDLRVLKARATRAIAPV